MNREEKWKRTFRRIRHGLKIEGWGYLDDMGSLRTWGHSNRGRKFCPRCPCGAEMIVTMRQQHMTVRHGRQPVVSYATDARCDACGRRVAALEEAHLDPHVAQLCVLRVEWVREPLIDVEVVRK